jgi:DNA primase
LRKVKVVRPDGEKKVWWEHKSKGWWESGTGGIATDHLLYRLETAKKMAVALRLPICIVEGEKDVDVLMHHGFPATCSAHGASEPNKAPKWYREHSDKLLGLALAVFNDADAAGRAHSRAICEQCYRRAKSIVVVDQETHFPGHKDIADAFKAGLDKGTLRDFIEGAPEYGT